MTYVGVCDWWLVGVHYYVGFCVSWLLFSELDVTSVFLCEVVFAGECRLLWVWGLCLCCWLRIGSLVVFGGLGFRGFGGFGGFWWGLGDIGVSWCLIGLVFGVDVLTFDLLVGFVMV